MQTTKGPALGGPHVDIVVPSPISPQWWCSQGSETTGPTGEWWLSNMGYGYADTSFS
jgi:hypothetical protein